MRQKRDKTRQKLFDAREPECFVAPTVQLGNMQRASQGKAPIDFMIRIRLADNSSIVWVHTIDSARGVEEGVAIDCKTVSVDLAGAGLKLILGHTLPKAILCREGALQNGELPDHIKRRIDVVLAALKFRECDGHPVKDH